MADDLGTLYTDKKLQTLERKLKAEYRKAQKDIEEKTKVFFDKAAAKDKVMQSRLSAGKITQEEYDHWRQGKIFYGENWRAQQESIAKVLADTNKVATAMINGEKADVFAFNGNYTGYELEHGFGVNFGFDLYSEKSVERLLKDNPKLMPPKRLDKRKDIPWNMRNIRSQVTQGLIQGESIPKIAKRLSEVVPNRNAKQMVLHARTAMTGAQNGGRMERFKEAEALGIKFKKVWIATLDSRTRDRHADLDGQAVKPDEYFDSGKFRIMFPGDPSGEPSTVWNCRCTLGTKLDDYPRTFTRRVQEDGSIISEQSYRQWEASKQNIGNTTTEVKKTRAELFEESLTKQAKKEYNMFGVEYGETMYLPVTDPETGELNEYKYWVSKEKDYEFPDGTSHGVYAKRDADIYMLENGTTFIIPSDLDVKQQSGTPEFFMERYMQLPKEYRDQIQKKVHILDYRNPQDANWAEKYHMKDFCSYATGGREISFYASTYHDPDYVVTTYAHEGGHFIDLWSGKESISESDRWKKAMKADEKKSKKKGITQYATAHVHEDWAESVGAYMTDQRKTMEESFPNRTKIIKEVIGIE